MDRSLVEKSFVVRQERQVRHKHLVNFVLFTALALCFKVHFVSKNFTQLFTQSKRLQNLISDTLVKISSVAAFYNFVAYVVQKVFKTRLQVTEHELTLLGIDSQDSSIDVSTRQTVKDSKPPLNTRHSEKTDMIADHLKTFQISADKSFDLPTGASKLNISPNSTKKMADLAEILDKNFSFNFPFKKNTSSLHFKNISDPHQFQHSSSRAKESKGSILKSYIQGYFSPAKREPKTSQFDKLETVEDFGLSQQQKMKCILKIRKWISRSILRNIHAEIQNINEYFRENGNFELIVGKCSCSALAKFAARNGDAIKRVSNLQNLISFLEVTSHQQYLVNRIKELSQDESLHRYNHNGGSSSPEFKWNQSLPTDSEILMHFFLTYMDIHYPDSCANLNKSFTAKYFNKTNPSAMKGDEFSIYQNQSPATSATSYFSLVIAGKHIVIEKNNDNMFLVICYLIIFAKHCMGGYIDSIDLGKSGINILSITE